MAELSLVWSGAVLGDSGPYTSEEWQHMYRILFLTTVADEGIINNYLNEMEVTGVATPMSVNTGAAINDGTPYENTAAVTVAIATPAVSTRIDRVVLRKSWAAQTVRITLVAGVEGGAAPTLVQNDGVTWDIPLAQASITTGGVITVTDERVNAETPLTISTDLTLSGDLAVNGGDITSTNATFTVSMSGTGRIRIDANGAVYFSDTANNKMTLGLTVNQGAADNEIYAGKSSDVAHPMTDEAETDTFYTVEKGQGNSGGAMISGWKSSDGADSQALVLRGVLGENGDATKTSAGRGVVEIQAYKTDGGTGIESLNSPGNVLAIRQGAVTAYIFDTSGSAIADVEWTTFDEHDDVAVLKDIETALVPSLFGRVVKHSGDFFEKHGLLYDVRHEEGKTRGMLNLTRMIMLQTGAISQMADKMARYEQALLDADIDVPKLEM